MLNSRKEEESAEDIWRQNNWLRSFTEGNSGSIATCQHSSQFSTSDDVSVASSHKSARVNLCISSIILPWFPFFLNWHTLGAHVCSYLVVHCNAEVFANNILGEFIVVT